ncbi:DNA polymerase III subunit beta [Dehalococcoides mccartyi]|uniref:DNA polymerase III subunit beta n=1 Tax=Dehalococcoides mccartyi TaxID=61435 RepID=A0AB38Z7Z5_9CHLR|nr:DNA polymerase III subunit beta [Dehalococcoides mccartyi]WRO06705.1 DNA polymerase III subunit beta [Dehalococcoides mccartyi]
MNIEGKRSGEGFCAHKAILVNALSRALAERVVLMDFTIGRKGFLTYIKSLGGSNVIKVVPSSNGNASGLRVADKRLKVVCGTNISYLEDMAWVGDKTPLTLCDVRVSPSNTVKPNLGALELSEALSRVVPFTTTEDSKPVLQCVLFRVKDGKLTLVSADGYRLAVVKLDFDGDEGQVLINRDELRGIISALRRAYRVRVGFEKSGESLDGMSLVLDTELIRYKWRGADGNFPEYEKLIPANFNTSVSFDTNEAIKAVSSLKVLSDSKNYPIDLTIVNGKLTMSSPDEKGQAEIPADTQGEGRIRLDGSYLADALRACGGMVELKLVDSKSPMLFTSPDYELVVMPMFAGEAQQPKGEPVKAEASQPTEPTETTEPEAETTEGEQSEVEEAEKVGAVAEAEAIANAKAEKPKHKAKRKAKEPVAVA